MATTKKESFIEMVEFLLEQADDKNTTINWEDGRIYFEALKSKDNTKEKTGFTENGKSILSYMKDNKVENNNLFKARDIAEGLLISTRAVSGAIRKLVTDGYVEKIGESPITYTLTSIGSEVDIDNN